MTETKTAGNRDMSASDEGVRARYWIETAYLLQDDAAIIPAD
ncbi:MAG: hypothetical protein WB608_08640 [Terracidiphilus sp.]